MDNELVLVWQVVNELSEQLAHNQKLTNALKSQAGLLKVRFRVSPYISACLHLQSKEQATQATAGFALRRVNADISKGSSHERLVHGIVHVIPSARNLRIGAGAI